MKRRILFVLVLITLTSCVKNHYCTCQSVDGENYEVFPYVMMRKAKAANLCEQNEPLNEWECSLMQ